MEIKKPQNPQNPKTPIYERIFIEFEINIKCRIKNEIDGNLIRELNHQSKNGSSFFGTSAERLSESGYSEKLEVSPAFPI